MPQTAKMRSMLVGNGETGGFRRYGTAFLSLAALWVWFFGAGNPGGAVFGLVLADTIPFRVGCQCVAAAAFFVLSFFRRPPFARVPARIQATVGAAGCVVSACLYRLGMWLGALWLVAVACVLVALSYMVCLRVWMGLFRGTFERLFPLVLLASACTLVVYLSTFVFSVSLGFPLALAAALAFGLLLRRAQGPASLLPATVATSIDPVSLCLQCGGIAMAYLAGALLRMEVVGGLEEWSYLSLVGSVFLAIVALWRREIRPPQIFVGLSLFACLCIACVEVSGVSSVVLGTLASASFWLMFLFAVAWLGDRDVVSSEVSCRLFLRGMAALLFAAALAKLIAHLGLPASSSLLLCALLTAVGLGIFFVGGMRGRTDAWEEREQDTPAVVQNPLFEDLEEKRRDDGLSLEARCRGVAKDRGLTEREESMLVLLSQGNSLKRAAEILYVSEGTAKYYRHNIYVKLGVSTRQELIDLVGAQGACTS